jgi:hypothetical protein
VEVAPVEHYGVRAPVPVHGLYLSSRSWWTLCVGGVAGEQVESRMFSADVFSTPGSLLPQTGEGGQGYEMSLLQSLGPRLYHWTVLRQNTLEQGLNVPLGQILLLSGPQVSL